MAVDKADTECVFVYVSNGLPLRDIQVLMNTDEMLQWSNVTQYDAVYANFHSKVQCGRKNKKWHESHYYFHGLNQNSIYPYQVHVNLQGNPHICSSKHQI